MSPQFRVERISKGDSWSQTPRLVCAFGDRNSDVAGMAPPLGVPPLMDEVRRAASAVAGHGFNYVLANLYRDGQDNTGWHADKAQYHQPDSWVAILSLGADRRFSLRRSGRREILWDQTLPNGSLLLMSIAIQATTEHSIPVMPELTDRRISLTMRNLRAAAPDE